MHLRFIKSELLGSVLKTYFFAGGVFTGHLNGFAGVPGFLLFVFMFSRSDLVNWNLRRKGQSSDVTPAIG